MRSNRRTFYAIFLWIAAVLLVTACRSDKAPTADPESKSGTLTLSTEQVKKIRVDTLAAAPFRRTIETTGTVAFDSDHATQVIAPISGPVTRLLVQIGAGVKAGDPLAAIASPDFAAAVSAYRKAEAAASNAQRIADLDEQLFKNDGIARRDMEQAQTDAVTAKADRDAALEQLRALGVTEKSLNDIKQNLPVSGNEAFIRSPLTGTIVERLITPGQLMQAGATPCFTVANTSTMWVMANVFESDLQFISKGDIAAITTTAATSALTGKVDYIADLVDPNTRAVAVRIVTPNTRELLKKDMYVHVSIHSSLEKMGLLVPVSALLRDDENLPFVFVQSGDNAFSRRQVTIGERQGDLQEIVSGLNPGDRIVVEGGLFMQFAQSQ